MTLENNLLNRAEHKCELCAADQNLQVYPVDPASRNEMDDNLIVCSTCNDLIGTNENANHWRCLNDSMWSPHSAVQITAWRQLTALGEEAWARDLLDMLYLEPDVLERAEASQTSQSEDASDDLQHIDSNGNILAAGDTVVLIKDLNVKGAGFTAKRGTAVRNIGLSPSNAEHIEGRVNGQHIVILTKFVKKS